MEENKELKTEKDVSPRMSIKEAAKKMKISQDVLRVGIQRERFPFAVAIKKDGGQNYSYYISRKKFEEFIG